jgi:hypothetical protein
VDPSWDGAAVPTEAGEEDRRERQAQRGDQEHHGSRLSDRGLRAWIDPGIVGQFPDGGREWNRQQQAGGDDERRSGDCAGQQTSAWSSP